MSDREVTYHGRFDDDTDELLALVRLRSEAGELHGERYQPGEGWVRDDYAFDVMHNGQDYDLVDEDDVPELAARLENESY